ncbi:bcl-2-related ovarian killer protein homolog B-like isoform X2 [Brevipalpus obovatus]|uniref:bcl-2-related ovarian killer protein homolog B-like isoform X2 n=1 Tax=Brevipalpus obovatus TaxID=246614 RepID=UPI003D9E13BF
MFRITTNTTTTTCVFVCLCVLLIRGKRLSAVGLAFTQQIQNMALRLSTNHQDVIEKLRILCARYLRTRLSESGLLTRRSCLQRLRSMGNIDFDPIYDDLMEKIQLLMNKLDSQRPGLYESVVEQIGNNKLILASPERAVQALTILLEQIFKKDISWPKIAAMFGICAALACDASKRGKQDYTINLIDAVAEFSQGPVSEWILEQGGWKSLLYRFNRKSPWTKVMRYATFATPTLFLLSAILWTYL